jgi:hypothetical protein
MQQSPKPRSPLGSANSDSVVTNARPNLSNGETHETKDVIIEFKDIFAMKGDDYRQTDGVPLQLDFQEVKSQKKQNEQQPVLLSSMI